MIDLEKFERALERAVDSIRTEGRKTTPMASTDIKRFTDTFRDVKKAVEQRMKQSAAALNTAHGKFKNAADNADGYIAAVDSYATELNSLAAELTNGGPALDDDFPAPSQSAPALPADPVQKLVATQEAMGHRHPSNQ